jgi:lipopolysaccharide transport system ATP-binding protein
VQTRNMSKTIIEVENLSKLYKLGSINTGTLSHDLNRWWRRATGKEDIVLKNASINDRTKRSIDGYVWSLKDINFQVGEGEIFGVIGQNGAGKSTLLKLLSKITKPTTGKIHLNGRIASLLEVGTGFHPDLTGRENVFLNGAILGMKKAEIIKNFDEIVDFSGIGGYIDTPVKKYSSGMYVRLAFAVAAHLEPDVLIIDEVLAVGDAEFQAKCMGKMKDVSLNRGRTILFVSHNIAAIKQLCDKALLLEHGMQKATGDIDDVLTMYQLEESDIEDGRRGKIPSDREGYFTDWKLENTDLQSKHTCYTGDTCIFSFGFMALESLKNCEIRLVIAYQETLILHASNLSHDGVSFSISPGYYRFKFEVALPIRDAKFDISANFLSFEKVIDTWTSSTKLTVLNNYQSNTIAGLINPYTKFYLTDEIAESVHK